MTGVRPLFLVSMRQDVRSIAPWAAIVAVLSASSILAYRLIFPELADRQGLAAAFSVNPAMELVFGPTRDLLTTDGFNAWRAGGLGAFLAGLMAILLVVRNSRGNEDSGQAELFASGVLSRPARLIVPLLMTTAAGIWTGIICFLLTVLSGGGVVASAVLSATFTASALLFGGVAAVTSQLASDARTASSLAVTVLGVTYAIRGYLHSVDASEWTQWLTPFGWFDRTGPAMENEIWPLAIPVVVAVILAFIAINLQQHRDFGLGVIPIGAGKARAPKLGLLGLTWHLHRGLIIGWSIAFVFLGFMWGKLAQTLGTLFESNPIIAVIVQSGSTTTDDLNSQFVAMIVSLLGIIASILGVQIMSRLVSEEWDYRVEPLLAAPVKRAKYFASVALPAFVSTAILMVISGTVFGIVSIGGELGVTFSEVLLQAIATISAVWVVVAISAAVVGIKPDKRIAAWVPVIASFGLTLLGPTFKLPEWALSISPFHDVPLVMAEDFSPTALSVLLAIAAGFLVLGFVGFRRRDVQ